MPLEEIEKIPKTDGKWSGELTHTIKNGGKVIVQSFQLVQFDADGKIVKILELNVDITEHKKGGIFLCGFFDTNSRVPSMVNLRSLSQSTFSVF